MSSTARQRLRPTARLYRAYLQVVLGLEALDGDLEHLDGLDRVVAHGLDLADGLVVGLGVGLGVGGRVGGRVGVRGRVRLRLRLRVRDRVLGWLALGLGLGLG